MTTWKDGSAGSRLGSELEDISSSVTTVSGIKTADYTITDTDRIVRVSNALSSLHITLPTAVGRLGRRFTITKVNPVNNIAACDVLTTSSQTISGHVPPLILYNAGDSIAVVSDGANWVREGGNLPTFRSHKEWFVGAFGDGRTPHTGFNTFAQAIAAASNGDTIWISANINEQIVINKSVRVIGVGNKPVITIPSGATAITDIGVKVTASDVVLENVEIRGHAAFKGICLATDTGSYNRFISITVGGTGITGTPTAYPTSPGAGTGLGGIGILCHRGEGNYFEQLKINNCSMGFAVGHECSVNSINRAVFSGCVQELVMCLNTGTISQPLQSGPFPYGGGNGGGWTFINLKSTTPVVTASPVVDLIGGGTTNYLGADGGSNTFINSDFSESGLPIVRIGTAGNTFIRPVSSPQCVWHIEGQKNHFINIRILGAGWVVSSDDNVFDNGWSNGCITGAGSGNRFHGIDFTSSAGFPLLMTGSDNQFDDDCTFSGFDGFTLPVIGDLGTRPSFSRRESVRALTYGTTITTDVRRGTYFTIAVTNGTGFTISNPIDTANGGDNSRIMRTNEITYRIRNSSGGTMGNITWGSQFKLVSTFTKPPNGENRTISFMRDGSDWVETSRSTAFEGLSDEITNRQNADNAHLAAADPHGDRAYADSVGVGGVPDGPAITSTLDNIHLPLWYPNRVPTGVDGDTTFAPDLSSERVVLEDGGMMSGNPLDYSITAAKATIAAGRFGASTTHTAGAGTLLYPIDGLLGLDEWTIECAVNPTADLSTQNTSIWTVGVTSLQSLSFYNEGTFLKCVLQVNESTYVPAGSNNVITAQVGIVSGDIPANTWTALTVRWKASTGILTVMIGNNAKVGNSSASPNPSWLTRPWWSDPRMGGLGIAIATYAAQGGAVTGLRVSDPIIRRYTRVYGEQSFRPRPAITMNASTTIAAWTGQEAGVVGHYTGWNDNEASETSTAAIRDLQLDLATDGGMRAVRLAQFHRRAIPTIVAGAITGINYTDLDTHWDRYMTRGIDKVHCFVGYTPSAFGASSQSVPTVSGLTEAQAFTLYASYISQVFGHLKARYPGVIKTISFWNEPSQGGFWFGTQAQLLDLWEAVAAKMETDHPDLPALGGVDEINGSPAVSSTSITVPESNHRQIITRSVSSGHLIGALFGHQYSLNFSENIEAWDSLRRYATAADAGLATVPFGVTEWGIINSAGAGSTNGISILGQESPKRQNGEWAAAYVHSFIAEMTKYGASFNHFFRLGPHDGISLTAPGAEDMMGLISNTGRPWPAFGAYCLMWKHAGNRVTSTPNFPHIHSIATKSAGGVITLTYSSFRSYKPTDTVRFQLSLSGLPATFTWKQWRVDQHEREQGIPTLVASGDQTNLPSSVEIGALGVGCIQVTP